ncbi:MAG: hypothetical protein WBA74_27455 [Cyclobacteriaceae bacterium]
MIKTFPLFYLFFISSALLAQEDQFDLKIRKTQEPIADIKYTGYITDFDIPKADLQRIWWKYSKSIGVVENMKTHYTVKIPAREKGYSSVSVIQKAKGNSKSSQLFLAIMDQTNNAYKAQIADLLLEFKVSYYADLMESKIVRKENELSDVSMRYQNLLLQSGKGEAKIPEDQEKEYLENISTLAYELEMLKRKLNQIK